MSETQLTASRVLPVGPIALPRRRTVIETPPEGRILQIQARHGAQLDAERLAFLADGDATALRQIAPGQWVVVADRPIASAEVTAVAARLAEVAHVFDIGPGRVRLRLTGTDVVEVLAPHVVVDLTTPRGFPVGRSTATLFGHVSVWLTRLAENAFEIVAPRSFAVAVLEDLTGAH